jgi:hypothetical protein
MHDVFRAGARGPGEEAWASEHSLKSTATSARSRLGPGAAALLTNFSRPPCMSPAIFRMLLAPAPGALALQQCAAEMSTLSARFDRWHLDWKLCLGAAPYQSGGGRFRHDSKRLLEVLRLAIRLRGGSSTLVRWIAQALSATLPPFLQRAFIDDVTGDLATPLKKMMPSPSSIRRAELSLDIALLTLQRQSGQKSTNVVRVGWADSSPLAGYDWIWSFARADTSAVAIRTNRVSCFSFR